MRSSSDLKDGISQYLPSGHVFDFHHVSTPPTLTCALYTPPSGTAPEKTYCESHLLLVSHVQQKEQFAAVFAIELLIYTTARLTTIFVSKADSTGFAANLPPTGSSLLRSLTSAFVSHIVEQRHRPDRRLVISLFARSQDQYLFPGSAENKTKHILNDRQLVRWWCRTLDPVLREYENEEFPHDIHTQSKAHLIVPGHNPRETAAFFPSSARSDPSNSKRWHNSHPLRKIAPYPPYTTAPRSLIPHFPDDPKSRFLLDLDEEISDAPIVQSQTHGSEQPSPSKRGTGMWKSVKSIELFWEMMAWRQECASGRLVGFLWITFTPGSLVGTQSSEQKKVHSPPTSPSLRPVKRKRAAAEEDSTVNKPAKRKKIALKRPRRLQGVIRPRAPRAKTASAIVSNVPEKTKHYYWPMRSRGDVILSEKAYQRVHEILLRLDFAGIETARASTAKWVGEVAIIAGRDQNDGWGVRIDGSAHVVAPAAKSPAASAVNTLDTSMVRKKQASEVPAVAEAPASDPQYSPASVNDLGATTVRKMPKQTTAPSQCVVDKPKENVNMLGAGFMRKKAKT